MEVMMEAIDFNELADDIAALAFNSDVTNEANEHMTPMARSHRRWTGRMSDKQEPPADARLQKLALSWR